MSIYIVRQNRPSRSRCRPEQTAAAPVLLLRPFSENIIVCLIQTLSVYPPGTFVLLSDESLGMVISTNFASMTRPVIMIYDPDASLDHVVVVDLADDKDLFIERILRPAELLPKVMEYWNPRRVAGYFFQIHDDRDDPTKKR